jgi:CubicO group peptidase (beta-lactamase class C family)
MNSWLKGALLALLLAMPAAKAEAPFIAPEDDDKHFGAPEDELFWTPAQQVAGYRNMDKITATRIVPAGEQPYALVRDERDLGGVLVTVDDVQMTVDEYVRDKNVAGLIVVKDDTILYERYELGNTPSSRWVSYSVAKSVTSLLVGAALHDGYLQSVDERISDYLPRLKGSSYDRVSVRNLLQMASGVEWTERYDDRETDIGQVPWDTLGLIDYLAQKPRLHEPGEAFNYNTAETNLVGILVRAAVGNNLSTYLSEKVWQPFGMEHDAYWNLTEKGGGEFGGSSLNATLRDYARIGLFALRDGVLPGGDRVLPEGWMRESTVPSTGYAEYGYLWWLRASGAYAAAGIFGQGIYVNPEHRVVIALHSAREVASVDADWALQNALFEAIATAIAD